MVALEDVSASVTQGTLLVVRGPSGSGKTTLLNILGGLDRPTSGSVYLDEKEVSAMAEGELLELRRTVLAFIFQFFGLVPGLSAAENGEVPLRLLSTAPAERQERVAAALEAVGLGGHANQRPYEISAGSSGWGSPGRSCPTRLS